MPSSPPIAHQQYNPMVPPMPTYPPPMPPSDVVEMPEAPSYSASGKLFDMDDEEDLYGEQPDQDGRYRSRSGAQAQAQGDGSCDVQ